MPRRPRLILPNVPLHLIQRGNNKQICFVAEEDYRFVLGNNRFAEQVGKALGRRVQPGKPGRPRKTSDSLLE